MTTVCRVAHQQTIDLLGADPRRPWPGIARDVVAASAGVAAMSRGRRVVRLGRNPDSWPVADHRADVVFAPLGFLTGSADPTESVDLLRSYLRVGGLCVTEEPAPPIADSSFVEPVAVEVDHVVLAAVDVAMGTYDLRLVRFDHHGQSVSVAHLAPMAPHEIDELMTAGFVPVGRWANWQGGPADGAPWHVALHRSVRLSQ